MSFIKNICPNPSFEVDLTGYTALSGTTIEKSFVNAFAGVASMKVNTTGILNLQGFFGPVAQFTSASLGSLSFYISGPTGQVQVSAVYNPGGNILDTQTIQLTTAWQRVEFSNLNVPLNDFLYFIVETPFPQDITFYVDAIQYEMVPTPSSYIDGDTYGCVWDGTAGLSSSTMEVQNPIVAHGGMFLEGLGRIIDQGEIFPVSDSGDMLMSGAVTVSVTDPVCALDDFGVWELTDLDPAMTYVGFNNANTSSGHTGYARLWSIFYPPLDYPVSDGTLAWPRAAYMASGYEFVNVPAGAGANITNHQAEMSPLAGSTGLDVTPAPSNYDTARAIHTIVKPTRLNFCPNPSFEVSTANWSAVGSATISQDGTVSFGNIGEWDGHIFSAGNKSGKASVASGTGGMSISVSNLIAGDTYIFSAYVKPGAGINDIQLTGSGAQSASVNTTLNGLGNLDTTNWYRPFMIFTATASTVNLFIQAVPGSAPAYPLTFNVDAVLVEAGEILGTYFDGDFESPEYGWETGGTAGLTRSYYYLALEVGQAVVDDILERHTPLGITAAAPLYFTPYTQ